MENGSHRPQLLLTGSFCGLLLVSYFAKALTLGES